MSSSTTANALMLMQNAARIMLAVQPHPLFTLPVALFCAGIEASDATNSDVIHQTSIIMKSLGDTEIVPYPTELNKRERAMILVSLAIHMPSIKRYTKKRGTVINLNDFKQSKWLTDTCCWAGFDEDELKPGQRPGYQTVHNFKQALSNNTVDPVICTSVPKDPLDTLSLKYPPKIVNISSDARAGHLVPYQPPLLSPLSMSKSVSSNATATTSSNASSAGTSMQMSVVSSGSFSTMYNGGKKKIMTASQKQHHRKDEEAWNRSYKSAFKLATSLLEDVKKKQCPLSKFKNADAVANFFNDGFVDGLPLISGREITEGVNNGLAGKSTPRKGRPTLISSDDTSDIASLVLTASAIDQANCEPNRLSRTQLTSVVGEIVNEKRKADGLVEIHDRTFFERIQTINSIVSDVQTPDKREMLRNMWLTVEQQKKHYMNWEQELIRLEFGRAPTDEREQQEKGFV